MSDYPPTFDELIDQLGEVVKRTENLPPELQSVGRDLAELYEKVRTAQSEFGSNPPEKIDSE